MSRAVRWGVVCVVTVGAFLLGLYPARWVLSVWLPEQQEVRWGVAAALGTIFATLVLAVGKGWAEGANPAPPPGGGTGRTRQRAFAADDAEIVQVGRDQGPDGAPAGPEPFAGADQSARATGRGRIVQVGRDQHTGRRNRGRR